MRRPAIGSALILAAAMPACSRGPGEGNMAAVALQQPLPAEAQSPAAAADEATPAAVLQRFLTGAAEGDAAAAVAWGGDAAEGRAALAAVRSHAGGAITIGTPGDEDAGAGQRFVTVPFTIGGVAGRAVLHKVADGIESDDPRAHDWRVRSLALPPRDEAVTVPATVEATYDCTPGGPVLMVRFDNRADTATLMLDGRTVRLAGQRPASGIWYAGDGYELRGKGRQARFAMPDGSARDCLAR